jgi:hypothetical protein
MGRDPGTFPGPDKYPGPANPGLLIDIYIYIYIHI